MGLDMNLYKRHYVKNWDMTPKEKRFDVTVKQGGKKVDSIKLERVCRIIEDIAYWRKANAIHNWFVSNVQNGEDDCKEYFVSRKQLRDLLDTINKVLNSSKLVKGKVHNGTRHENGTTTEIMEDGKIVEDSTVAEELLPTTEGFFFGSTDYDQYYIQDLEYTKKVLTEELALPENGDYYYSSSW